MALRAAKANEDALGGRGARAHACRLDTRVEAWLLRPTNRVFKGGGHLGSSAPFGEVDLEDPA
jgi:hypothetical protein